MTARGPIGVLVLTVLSNLWACAGTPQASAPVASRSPDASVDFAFVAVDGRELSSRTTRGRVTAIFFLASYDVGSQVVARHLEQLSHTQTPRINVGGVALEPPKYAPLVEAFAESLGLDYPVAMADYATREGRGAFGRVRGVPTIVVLDAQGRESWRREGVASEPEIEEALAKAGGRVNAPRD